MSYAKLILENTLLSAYNCQSIFGWYFTVIYIMKSVGFYFFQVTNKNAGHVFKLHVPLSSALLMFQACPCQDSVWSISSQGFIFWVPQVGWLWTRTTLLESHEQQKASQTAYLNYLHPGISTTHSVIPRPLSSHSLHAGLWAWSLSCPLTLLSSYAHFFSW